MASIVSGISLPTELILSFALGTGARPAVEPFVQDLANQAWTLNPAVPPNAILLAEGVAQGQVAKAAAYNWAKQQGFDTAQMDAMVDIANVGPGAAFAFELWRRGLIDQAGFATALKRLGIEDRWVAPLEALHDRLLSSEELGMLQQQGFIDAARANSEGALQGVTNERQQLRFEASGLPPGIGEALTMLRRGIIDQQTFAQIVREGHTKTKYTGALTQLERQLLSPATAVRSRLKGHIDTAEMHARGQDWGYTPADMDLWYLSEGRPATAHQIHIGYARGATVPGATDEQDAIATAVKQSDVRPEYTDVIFAGRATYPSLFQLTRLVDSGTISPDTGAEWAHKSGLAAEVVTALHTEWSGGGGGGGADSNVKKAQTRLYTTTHNSYMGHEISDATATAALETAGVAAGSAPAVLSIWQVERDLIRKGLSAANIRKAWFEQVTDPALGRALTEAEAVQRLEELGYSADDARVYLLL